MVVNKKVLTGICFSLFLLSFSQKSFSINTIETFDPHSGYFSLNFGFTDLKPGLNGSKVNTMAVLGKGLNPFISAYMGVQLQGNRFLSYGESGLFLGAIATLYSFNRFSFDMTLEAGLINDYFYSAPGIEINFDLAPDQQFMGFYVDATEHMTGADDSGSGLKFTPETELCVGYYLSLIEGQQFHIRFDQRFRHNPAYNEPKYEIDALKLGYNLMISDGFQIQTEFEYQIPQRNDKNSFGVRIGLVKW